MKVVVFSAILLATCHALNNGAGRVPAMGYNTWNDFRCNINEADIFSIAGLIQERFAPFGYQYVNMDDCWAQGRYTNGTVYPDPNAFPNGIKHVADFVHGMGLKFGIYTDRGTQTCAGRPGSFGYEVTDAQTYASWGVDYLKEDSCHASQNHKEAFNEYGKMRDALNATGRSIYFSLCGWNTWYAPQGKLLGNSWRIAGDVNSWNDVVNALNANSGLVGDAGPGGWNDPDMLVGSTPGSAAIMTPTQSRAQFSLWAVMAAPLLLGGNVRNMSTWDYETYTNRLVITINQDTLGAQGSRIVNSGNGQVWARKLNQTDTFAVAMVNVGSPDLRVTCSQECFQQMGLYNASLPYVIALDAWTEEVEVVHNWNLSVNLPPLGGFRLFVIIATA